MPIILVLRSWGQKDQTFKVISDYIAIVSQHGIQESLPYTTNKESLYRSGRGQIDALDVKGSSYSYRRPEIGSPHWGLKISYSSSSMDLTPSPGFCWQVHTGAHTHFQILVHTQLKINKSFFKSEKWGVSAAILKCDFCWQDSPGTSLQWHEIMLSAIQTLHKHLQCVCRGSSCIFLICFSADLNLLITPPEGKNDSHQG